MPVDDRRKYGTANPVLQEARIHHDPHDEFAWVQNWRFSLAQFLTDCGEYVPDFRGGDDIRDDHPYELLDGLYPDARDHIYDREAQELRYALTILDRYREWLRAAGKDY